MKLKTKLVALSLLTLLSSAATSTLRTRGSSDVPALPGATKTCLTRGDCAAFHASACSRPPEPMIRTFMGEWGGKAATGKRLVISG